MFKLLPLIILISLYGCKLKEEDDVLSCSFDEQHFHNSSSDSFSLGEMVGQKFIVNADVKLTKIVLQMDVQNSQTLSLSLFKNVSGTPADAQLIEKVTVTSSNYATTDKVTFKFKGKLLSPGENYYFILESTGGAFAVNMQTASVFNIIGEVWEYRSSSWSSDTSVDLSFQVAGECIL